MSENVDTERDTQRQIRLKSYFSMREKKMSRSQKKRRNKKINKKKFQEGFSKAIKKSAPSVFNNPAAQRAYDSLDQEEKDYYKAVGNRLYDNDLIDGTEDNLEKGLRESFAYISESLKSGLDPQELDDGELAVMEEVGGENWFLAFNFTKDDLL